MFENAYPEKVPNLKKDKSEYSQGVHERFFFTLLPKLRHHMGLLWGFMTFLDLVSKNSIFGRFLWFLSKNLWAQIYWGAQWQKRQVWHPEPSLVHVFRLEIGICLSHYQKPHFLGNTLSFWIFKDEIGCFIDLIWHSMACGWLGWAPKHVFW